MNDFLFMSFMSRVLLVACSVAAFRFARARSFGPRQSMLLCAATAALFNFVWLATMAFTQLLRFPSTRDFVLVAALGAACCSIMGLLFAGVALWRRVASTGRLVTIVLVMIVVVDAIHFMPDPISGLGIEEARRAMLMLTLVVGSLMYVWNAGAKRELPVEPEGKT